MEHRVPLTVPRLDAMIGTPQIVEAEKTLSVTENKHFYQPSFLGLIINFSRTAFSDFFFIAIVIVFLSTELRVLSLFPRSRHTCSLHTFSRHILVLRHILFLSSYPRVFLIRSGRPNGKGGISVRD